jgi:hypothetical protein
VIWQKKGGYDMMRGHVVSLNDGSSYFFIEETSEGDAKKFAEAHSSENPIISPLGGADAYVKADDDHWTTEISQFL